MTDIEKIKDPYFIKEKNISELNALSDEIRTFLIEKVQLKGGHLSSNLGVVETIISMHKIFDYKEDVFIFDTGHQCYPHKILTGRAKQFNTLREYNGLSGFPETSEDKYDRWNVGHAGTGISAGLAYSIDTSMKVEPNDKKNILVHIGDAAFVNGVSLEAFNDKSFNNKKIIILLNDNGKSIANSVGSFSSTLTKLRISKFYDRLNHLQNLAITKNNSIKLVYKFFFQTLDYFTKKILANYFLTFGFKYLGVIDGHNIKDLLKALKYAKFQEKKIIVHIKTIKGFGLNKNFLNLPDSSHKVYIEKKTVSNTTMNNIKFPSVVSNWLKNEYKKNKKIIIITPAMSLGSKLTGFDDIDDKRFFDVGIAESHATIVAAVLSKLNYFPFLCIYSTFLQRAYDQLIHDIAINDSHVVIGIDRANLVGQDGITHHGIFDIGFINTIPNIQLVAPSCLKTTNLLLKYSFYNQKHPIAIRYSNEVCDDYSLDISEITKPLWIDIFKNLSKSKIIIITYGSDFWKIYEHIQKNKLLKICLINALFLKDIDNNMFKEILKQNKPIFVFEKVPKNNSLFNHLLLRINSYNVSFNFNNIFFFGLENKFYKHGLVADLYEHNNVTINKLFNLIYNKFNMKDFL